MAYRAATGRKIAVKRNPKTARDVMRRHLREEGHTIAALARVWDMHPTSAYRRFYEPERPLSPQYIEAFIEWLKLDDFDAYELRYLGAIESGWQIDKNPNAKSPGV